jgi:hypothetical protein
LVGIRHRYRQPRRGAVVGLWNGHREPGWRSLDLRPDQVERDGARKSEHLWHGTDRAGRRGRECLRHEHGGDIGVDLAASHRRGDRNHAGVAPTASDTAIVVVQSPNGGPADYPAGAVPINASATGTTGAVTATLPASASGQKTYICGFSARSNATAAATGDLTISNLTTAGGGGGAGTEHHTHWTAPNASGIGLTEMIYPKCQPSNTTNQTIPVAMPAPGTGGAGSVSAWGYQL